MRVLPTANLTEPGNCKRVLVGLLGRGISASRTPRMHMAEGRALGLDYDYRLIDLAESEAEPPMEVLLNELESAGYRGVNVTYPYKQSVIPHLTDMSVNARAIGAVNTIVFRDGARSGHNTDYWGFGESFRRGLPGVKRDAALLLGAGGAGGAVSAALLSEGIGRLMIHDTTRAKAVSLVQSLNQRFGAGRAEVCSDPMIAAARADGIVNASPVGMQKMPGLPVPESAIEARHWVADVVYFPLETELLAVARAKGCSVLPGSGMALFQAVRAFELFTGLPADPSRMQATFDGFDAEVTT